MRARSRASLAQSIVDDPRRLVALALRNNPEAVDAALFRLGYQTRSLAERVDVLRTLDARTLQQVLSVPLRLDRLSVADLDGLARIKTANSNRGPQALGSEGQEADEDIGDPPDGQEEDDDGGGNGQGWAVLSDFFLGLVGHGVNLMDDGAWNLLIANWMGLPMPGGQTTPPPSARPSWVTPLIIAGGVLLLGVVLYLFTKKK